MNPEERARSVKLLKELQALVGAIQVLQTLPIGELQDRCIKVIVSYQVEEGDYMLMDNIIEEVSGDMEEVRD